MNQFYLLHNLPHLQIDLLQVNGGEYYITISHDSEKKTEKRQSIFSCIKTVTSTILNVNCFDS